MISYSWLIVLLPVLAGTAGYLYSQSQEPMYEAKASFLVREYGTGFTPTATNFHQADQLAATYRRLVTTSPFLERVGKRQEIPVGALASVSSSTQQDPPIVNVLVKHTDAEIAAIVAQAVADELVDYIFELRMADISRLQAAATSQGISGINELVAAQFTAINSLNLLEPVPIPGRPVTPKTRQNVLLAVLLGFIIAFGLAIGGDNLRDTIRFADQLTQRFQVASLGAVFKWRNDEVSASQLVVNNAPNSNYAEAFRQIRANVEFATVGLESKRIMISSPGPGEGKSTLASNLAVSLTNAGKKVILIDADFRRPKIHTLFEGMVREPGLSNYLADPAIDVSAVIKEAQIEGLHLITSGPTPPMPAELLSTPRMIELLSTTSDNYDFVLVDTPPILLVADGSILAAQMDGAIVVVEGFRTRSSALRSTLGTLENTGVKMLGGVINKLKRPSLGYGYAYSYHYQPYGRYYYGSDTEQAQDGAGPLYKRLAKRVKSTLSRHKQV